MFIRMRAVLNARRDRNALINQMRRDDDTIREVRRSTDRERLDSFSTSPSGYVRSAVADNPLTENL